MATYRQWTGSTPIGSAQTCSSCLPTPPTSADPGSRFQAQYGPLWDGDSASAWYTNSFTSLTGNEGAFNGNGAANPAQQYSVVIPTSGSPSQFASNTPGCSIGETYGEHLGAGLSQGYIEIMPELYYYTSGGYNRALWTVAVEHRASSSASWSTAVDINGVALQYGGNWRMKSTGGGMSSFSGEGGGNTMCTSLVSGSNYASGSTVGVYSATGDYRITSSNNFMYVGHYPTYQCNNVSCDFNCYETGAGEAYISINPATGSSGSWATAGSLYEYKYDTALNGNYTNSFWSYSPYAKYVAYAYTSTAGTALKTAVNGTIYYKQASGGNPEYAKDGIYSATFSSAQRTSVPSPNMYT